MANLLPTVENMATQKPQPLQVSIPSGTRTAELNPVGNGSRYVQAANNSREAAAEVNRVHNENLRALATISPDVAAKLQGMQEDAFADGYLKRMQGQSIEDIQKDQGFMANLFGDGNAVRGARAAQVQSTGDSLVEWLNLNQDSLSNLPLDAQRKALADQMQALKTGDDEQDKLIAGRMMQVFPTIMESLARSTHVETQRKAAIAQADALSQKGNNLQFLSGELAKGNITEDNYNAALTDYMQSVEPLPGQTRAAWRANMQTSVADMTSKGQFEAATALKERLAKDMTTEERMKLDAQVSRQQAKWLVDNPMSQDYTDFKVGLPQQIMAGRFSNPQDIDDAIDFMNSEHESTTHSLSPLVNNEERSKMHVYYQKYLEEQAKLQGKQDMEALYLNGYANGSPETMQAASLPADRKAAIEKGIADGFMNTEDATETVGKLASVGYTNGFIKEPIQRTVGLLKGGGVPSQEALQSLQMAYKKLSTSPYGMGAVEAYFGSDGLKIASDMEAMDMTNPANMRYISDHAQNLGKKVNVPANVLKDATAAVEGQFQGGWLSRTFGSRIALGEGTKSELQQQLTGETARVMAEYPELNKDTVISIATQRVRQNTSLLGDHMLMGPGARDLFGKVNKGLKVPISSPNDPAFNGALESAVHSMVPDIDYKLGNVYVPSGNLMRVSLISPDGTYRDIVLPVGKISDSLNGKQAAETKHYRQLHDMEDDSRPKHTVTFADGTQALEAD